ncbi:hypothetical protein GCM10023213_19990 [Prosthecobacter algae]|uniref:Uncharacterized protein n=1 Tax=Prosthecobacter algae TaxID=1144682 RepID=A0ABP9P528_9BACT
MRKRSEIDIRPLIEKLKRVPGALGKEMTTLINQEAKLFISGGRGTPGVIEITPPANAGNTGIKAKKQGESAVQRDIYRVYATPRQAYDALKEVDIDSAKIFWALFRGGDFTGAGEILRNVGGRTFIATRSFAKFDEGVMHKRFRNKQGRITRQRVMMVVTDAAELKAYVKKMQGRVGLLSSGWVSAASKLGVRLPAWITRHGSGNGDIAIEMSGTEKMVIVMKNRVKYGAANDLQRRVDYVIRYRKKALNRRLPYVLRAALKKAGFSTSRAAA